MTSMSISLPDEIKEFVEARAASEGYASASDYCLALIREARKRLTKQELELKLAEAISSGPAEPMTRADWDDRERRVGERDSLDRHQS
ncbi:MAG: type II toxin-antitoxin system ParD family antitoxin [Isosphaeraceae bacterium]